MQDAATEIVIIYLSVILALGWSIFNVFAIRKVKIDKISQFESVESSSLVNLKKLDMIEIIGNKISKGANAFLIQEYSVMAVFIVIFAVIVLIVVDVFGHEETKFRFYTTFTFVVGAITSMLCGFIGMRVAVSANYRTTYMAM